MFLQEYIVVKVIELYVQTNGWQVVYNSLNGMSLKLEQNLLQWFYWGVHTLSLCLNICEEYSVVLCIT